MRIETKAVWPPGQAQDRKLPATFRSPNHHLLEMRADIALTDPQEPGERRLKISIFAPVAGGDRNSPERQRAALLQ